MSKIEELRAAHQYFEYLWFARDAGDTYSIGSGDDIIATSTSESLARFTVCAHKNMPALLEAVEILKHCVPVMERMYGPAGHRAPLVTQARAALEKLK